MFQGQQKKQFFHPSLATILTIRNSSNGVPLKSIVSFEEMEAGSSLQKFITIPSPSPSVVQYLFEMNKAYDGRIIRVARKEETGETEPYESDIELEVSSCFLDSFFNYLSEDDDLRTASEVRMQTEEGEVKQYGVTKERELIDDNNIMQSMNTKNALGYQPKPNMVVLGKITDSVVVMDRSNIPRMQNEPINTSQIIVSGEPALAHSHFMAADSSMSSSGASKPSAVPQNSQNKVPEPSPYHQDSKQNQQRNREKGRNFSSIQELKLSKLSPRHSGNVQGKAQNRKQVDNASQFEDYNIPNNIHNPFTEPKRPPSSSKKGSRASSKGLKKEVWNQKRTDNTLLANLNGKSQTESTSNIEQKLKNGQKAKKGTDPQRSENPYETNIGQQIIIKLSKLQHYVTNIQKDVRQQKNSNRSGSRSRGYDQLGQDMYLFGSGKDLFQNRYDDDDDSSSQSSEGSIRQIKSNGINEYTASRIPIKVQRAYSYKKKKVCNPDAKTVKEIDQDGYITWNNVKRVKSREDERMKSREDYRMKSREDTRMRNSKGLQGRIRRTERLISSYKDDEINQDLKFVKSIDMEIFDYGPKEGESRHVILDKIFDALKRIRILRGDVRNLPDYKIKIRSGYVQFRVSPTTKDVLLWHFNGRFYYGGWQEMNRQKGQKSGEGLDIAPQHYIYKGSFKENQRSGEGVAIFPVKKSYQTYKGSWKNDCFNGVGVFKTLESTYKGNFKEGLKHGTGREYFQDGDEYRGEYRNNSFHGQGCYKWKNGAIYTGDFKYGLKHGEGIWKSPTGDVFSGQYSQNQRHGYGIYKWKDGNIYQGYFSRGMRCDDRKNRQIEEELELSQSIEESIDVSESIEHYEKEHRSNRNQHLPNGNQHLPNGSEHRSNGKDRLPNSEHRSNGKQQKKGKEFQ